MLRRPSMGVELSPILNALNLNIPTKRDFPKISENGPSEKYFDFGYQNLKAYFIIKPYVKKAINGY